MSRKRLLFSAPARVQLGGIGSVVMSEGLPARAWRSLCDEGLRSTWFRFLATLGYRRLYVLRRSLEEPIPVRPSRLPLSIDWLTREGLEAYRSIRAGNDNATMLLAEGDRCLIARHEGRIVEALWGSSRRARAEPPDRDLTLVRPENRAALQTHARAGCRIDGRVRNRLLGPSRSHWLPQPIRAATAASPPCRPDRCLVRC